MVISNFSVNPGDEIYSQVAVGDSNGNLTPFGGYAYFYLGDITTGQSTFFSTPITGIFSGVSAEWTLATAIHERKFHRFSGLLVCGDAGPMGIYLQR